MIAKEFASMSISAEQSSEVAARMEKHIDLHEAIGQLSQIINHLEALYSKITGEPECKGSGGNVIDTQTPNKSNLPSLIEVLEEGPKRIRYSIEECHKMIEQIKSVLF